MNNKKIALIFGITGMDGSHLADLLLSKDYSIIGVKRRTATPNTSNIEHIINNPNLKLIEGDLTDPSSVNEIISTYKPDELYLLAAQSHVGTSFNQPSYTFDVDAKGPLLVYEAVRIYSPKTRIYFAATSEMFGSNYTEKILPGPYGIDDKWKTEIFQNENTPLSPNSPYAVAKVAAFNLARVYRESYGLFISCGILFNHESERRGENFVTRKITKYIGKLNRFLNSGIDWVCPTSGLKGKKLFGSFEKLKLGNLDAIRDWGYAPEYVEAMWKMLQQDKSDDFIIGTETGHSVKEFLIEAFHIVGLNWEDFVEFDKGCTRPCEVPYLRCDASKAKKILGWNPQVRFNELVKKMVEHDINVARN